MNKRTRKVMHSSKTDKHATPQSFFDMVAAEWGPFDLDVCADAENAKCPLFFTQEQDGLAQSWITDCITTDVFRCWMNPPYGRGIGKWLAKAAETAAAGGYVVALIPARTDTQWWHDYVQPVLEEFPERVGFIQGRLKFGGAKNAAPFPSVLVVFGERNGTV